MAHVQQLGQVSDATATGEDCLVADGTTTNPTLPRLGDEYEQRAANPNQTVERQFEASPTKTLSLLDEENLDACGTYALRSACVCGMSFIILPTTDGNLWRKSRPGGAAGSAVWGTCGFADCIATLVALANARLVVPRLAMPQDAPRNRRGVVFSEKVGGRKEARSHVDFDDQRLGYAANSSKRDSVKRTPETARDNSLTCGVGAGVSQKQDGDYHKENIRERCHDLRICAVRTNSLTQVQPMSTTTYVLARLD